MPRTRSPPPCCAWFPSPSRCDGEELAPLPRRVEIIIELPRHRPADAWRLFEVLERSALDRARRTEMHQQCALAVGADAGDVVEGRSGEALRPLGAMRSDCETVSLVAQALEIEEQSRIGLQRDFAAS